MNPLVFSTIVTRKWFVPVVVIVLAIITILVIYYLGKRSGKKQNEYLTPPNETGWGGNLTPTESNKVKQMTNDIYEDIYSWQVSAGWKQRNCDVYKDLVSESDKITVAVANYYIQTHGVKLYDDVEGESFATTRGCSNDLRESVLNKLIRLNLK